LGSLSVELSAEEVEQLEAPYEPHAIAGFDPPNRRPRQG
jgi:hypothetical protein